GANIEALGTERGQLNGTHVVASRVLPNGPGPSSVDLPAPGCWTLNLSWAGHHDQLDLWYTAMWPEPAHRRLAEPSRQRSPAACPCSRTNRLTESHLPAGF